jgi:colanic acid/amylovoran biosynthesis glycosyltransferase
MVASPLRLLIVGISWPPETFLDRLIQGLARAGLEITIACPEEPDGNWLSQPGLAWLPTPGANGSGPHRLLEVGGVFLKAWGRDPQGLCRLAGFLQGSRGNSGGHRDKGRQWRRLLPFVGRHWDVIYFPWNSAAIEHLPLFDLSGCPVVVSCRGSQVNIAPHDPGRKGFVDGLQLTFEKAAAVHCVSEAMRDEARQYGLSSDKAWVIRPAVDPDFFCPGEKAGIGPGIFQIAMVGSLIWTKGYEYALLALRRLLDRGVQAHLHIVGDGPERPRLLYTIQDLELGGQVFLHGRWSPEEVRRQLRQADVFLLSSLSEGISNALLEAMACGLPVAATACGGTREAVTDEVEGFVVPVRDPEAMAAALALLASQAELRRSLGQAARKRVIRQFHLAGQIEGFTALFQYASQRRAAAP